MRKVAAAVFIIASLAAAPAWACSCDMSWGVESSYIDSKAVFIGKVIARKQKLAGPYNPPWLTEEATLRVERAWKGVKVGDTVTTKTHLGIGGCGLPLTNDPVWYRDVNEKPMPMADTWYMFVGGDAPYEVHICRHSRPTDMVTPDGPTTEKLDVLQKKYGTP